MVQAVLRREYVHRSLIAKYGTDAISDPGKAAPTRLGAYEISNFDIFSAL